MEAMPKPLKNLAVITLACLFMVLTSCSGGGNSSNNEITGVVVDSALVNLRFSTDTGVDGFTGPSGNFTVPSDANLNFFVGDILLNQLPIPAAAVITLVDFVPAAVDETHPTVINLARFLQSLDSVAPLGDGIQISADAHVMAAGMSIDFSSATTFDTDAMSYLSSLQGNPPLVSAVDAQDHLADSLISTCGGVYQGTFLGDDAGDFIVLINRSGLIEGFALAFDETIAFRLVGNAFSDCSAQFDDGNNGPLFSGQLADGTISGTWSNPLTMQAGTFSGFRTTSYDATLSSTDIEVFDSQLSNADFEGTFDFQGPTGPPVSGNSCLFIEANGNAFMFLDTPGTEGCIEATVLAIRNGTLFFAGIGNLEGSDFNLIEGSVDVFDLTGGGIISAPFDGVGTFQLSEAVAP